MKLIKIVALYLSIISLALMGCDLSDDVYPEDPASATGITDNNGNVTLDFGSHMITVRAVDFIPQGVSGITVIGHLFKDNLYVYTVGDDTWYSNHKIISYDEFDGSSGTGYAAGKLASPQNVQGNVEIELTRITSEVYPYSEDPEYQDALLIDEWATVNTFTGTPAMIFAKADSAAKDRNIIVHITDDVANQTNSAIQTISMVLDSTVVTSDTVFSVLLGLEFHIFSSDTLSFSTISYGDSILPVIYIHDAELGEGDFFCQFTLTWGQLPDDLDSHLWTPSILGSSYHVYYVNRGSIGSAPYAFLDVDDVTSWGPEHIMIQQEFPGTYYYSVHHFAGESHIPVSGAKVSVLLPDRSVREFTPPNQVDTGEGWYWHVCSIDGTTGEITEIGRMTLYPPTTSYGLSPMPPKSH